MSTAVSDLITRALGYSVQNSDPALSGNSAEMIAVVAGFERDIYRVAAQDNRFFVHTASLTSTSGSSGRTVDLTTATPAIERLLRVQLPGGVWLSIVDFEDPDAEIAPRGYVLGQTLTEYLSEWGASGTVTFSIDYGVKPATLDPTAALSQTVTLPDEYTDLLVLRLANYLATKDVGRDPAEAQTLDTLYQSRLQDVTASLFHFPGVVRRRFLAPNLIPGGSE
ncbi:MAG TPA: hypothetical protein VJ826_00560 [Candidatus Polarisedimenticolaceae bacterium]|nr:hypothetical protein [Candidatus Polarisedimenticolaceae bacterium]